MANQHIVVITTCPAGDCARSLAKLLIDKRLAACVSILPQIHSVYIWQDKCQSDTETMLLIKTRRDAYNKVEQAIMATHPYELPEIIAVPISTGLPAYLTWIDKCLDMN